MDRAVIVPACLALALTGCIGGTDPQQQATVAGTRTQASPSPVTADGAPLARMQVATDSVEGVLVRLCDGDACDMAAASPSRALEMAGDGLVLFALSDPPESARVEVRREGADAVAERTALAPGSLMGFPARLARGRYDIRLVARWAERRAVWRFSLKVPRADA